MSRRKTIEWCCQLAEARGGRCLSTEYGGIKFKYLWECKEGHQWEAQATSIQQGCWCPHCAQKAPHHLQWLQGLAAKRGGLCLSVEYKNAHTKYLWECAEGHRWEAKSNDIQQGYWCPHCAGHLPKTLQWLQELAAGRGGLCLSTEYRGTNSKYLWECGKRHQWEATANDIQGGHWCPRCAGNTCKTFRWLQELAVEMGGKCLSTEYKNNATKYFWECSKGHRWEAKANDIQRGSWCPHCAGNTRKNLQWLQELTAERGGKCLSTEYKNSQTKYPWECSKGHRWEASANSVQRGHWCPRCAHRTSKLETQLLEFVQQFCPDARKGKKLLKNKNFELDVYIPSLHKAIEFDGEYWHHSEWAIQKGKPQRDQRKNQQCADAGIQLLRVRERDYLADPEAVKQQILEFLGTQTLV